LFCCLPSVLAASVAGVCQASQACTDPRLKKQTQKHQLCQIQLHDACTTLHNRLPALYTATAAVSCAPYTCFTALLQDQLMATITLCHANDPRVQMPALPSSVKPAAATCTPPCGGSLCATKCTHPHTTCYTAPKASTIYASGHQSTKRHARWARCTSTMALHRRCYMAARSSRDARIHAADHAAIIENSSGKWSMDQ
jgi:hypothetical protein